VVCRQLEKREMVEKLSRNGSRAIGPDPTLFSILFNWSPQKISLKATDQVARFHTIQTAQSDSIPCASAR
jgi:hypothetical protein